MLSSPIGPRPLGGGPIPSSLDEQLVLTFANLGRVLDAAGIGPDDVMFVRVFVAELGVRTAFNESWSAFFGADGPARQVTEQRLPEGAQVLLRFMALEPA